MEKINDLINEAIERLKNNEADYTDFELVYYDCYLVLEDEVKTNIGRVLLDSSLVNLKEEQVDGFNILRNVIKNDLCISKVLK